MINDLDYRDWRFYMLHKISHFLGIYRKKEFFSYRGRHVYIVYACLDCNKIESFYIGEHKNELSRL